MDLAHELRRALSASLAPDAGTKAIAGTLSRRFRLGSVAGEHLTYGTREAIAYALYRMPATFAAVRSAFLAGANRHSGIEPKSLLDVGSGTGAAVWAAVSTWGELEHITATEPNEAMRAIGERLAKSCELAALRETQWDSCLPHFVNGADVVASSYVLGEIEADDRKEFLRELWSQTQQILVLVEPGTPSGSETIAMASIQLQEAGAEISAPFSSSWDLSAQGLPWMHFAVRVPRTPTMKTLKQAQKAYEDEKYSYLVAARTRGSPYSARVVRHPYFGQGWTELELLTLRGPLRLRVSRRNPNGYKIARRLSWGASLDQRELELITGGRS